MVMPTASSKMSKKRLCTRRGCNLTDSLCKISIIHRMVEQATNSCRIMPSRVCLIGLCLYDIDLYWPKEQNILLWIGINLRIHTGINGVHSRVSNERISTVPHKSWFCRSPQWMNTHSSYSYFFCSSPLAVAAMLLIQPNCFQTSATSSKSTGLDLAALQSKLGTVCRALNLISVRIWTRKAAFQKMMPLHLNQCWF